ncbi:MAG: hypothetical protein ABSG25_06345 [Bryobacteraceae bacterium]
MIKIGEKVILKDLSKMFPRKKQTDNGIHIKTMKKWFNKTFVVKERVYNEYFLKRKGYNYRYYFNERYLIVDKEIKLKLLNKLF